MKTFEEIVDLVTELSLDNQELLINILQHRTTEIRRKELAQSSQAALAEFRAGNLKAQTADEAIADLRNYLNNPEIE
jgi:tryptophan 2,3-dioxygenase